MSIVVTGATGQLGRLTVEALLRRGVPAAAISAAAGQQVSYTDLPAFELARVLVGVGLPAELAEVLADADLGLGRGELFTDSGDLRGLIGRPATPLADAIAAALR